MHVLQYGQPQDPATTSLNNGIDSQRLILKKMTAPLRLFSVLVLHAAIFLQFLLVPSLAASGVANEKTQGSDGEFCTAPSSSSWERPFLVAVVADPQVGWNLDGYNSEELLEVAAEHLERLQPDFILVAGDLVQTAGSRRQYEISKSIMDSIGIPYYCISGNHDVRSTPRIDYLDEFLEWWETPYYWYTIPYYNTLFVMLESNILRVRDGSDTSNEISQLAWDELDWLQETLQQSGRFDHIIPIAHHPLAVRRLNEGDKKQNMPREVRDDLREIYLSHSDQISLVLAGHFHTSARVAEDDETIEYVTYPSTGVILGSSPRDPSGFALLEVDGMSLKETYYGYQDMPEVRPESNNRSFSITFPNGQEDLFMGALVCVSWTSTSMADKAHLEYSLNDGETWEPIAEFVSNQGVYPWTVPQSSSNNVLVKVSSAYDDSIFGSSQASNTIVSLEEANTEEPPIEENEQVAETAVPTDGSTMAWSSIFTKTVTFDPSSTETTSPSEEATSSVTSGTSRSLRLFKFNIG
jgi:predicted phosphodiesterase